MTNQTSCIQCEGASCKHWSMENGFATCSYSGQNIVTKDFHCPMWIRTDLIIRIKNAILDENEAYTQEYINLGHDDLEGKWKSISIEKGVKIHFSQSFGYLDIEGITKEEYKKLLQMFPTCEEAFEAYMAVEPYLDED